MQLQDQVTSLELSKRLKELGVKQESLFYWFKTHFPGGNTVRVTQEDYNEEGKFELYDNVFSLDKIPNIYDYDEQLVTEQYSAYTVSELGEMLPPYIEINSITYSVGWWKSSEANKKQFGLHSCAYEILDRDDSEPFYKFSDDTEANARAKMLIYLLENNLLTPTTRGKGGKV